MIAPLAKERIPRSLFLCYTAINRMRIIGISVLAVFLCCSPHPSLQEQKNVEQIAPEDRITPHYDSLSKTIYIPKDLDECFAELKIMLHPDKVAEIKAGQEEDMIQYHFGLGMWIRNNWGLWEDSKLYMYFKEMGLYHPDDMSALILDSFHRHVNGKKLEMHAQIQVYIKHWKGFFGESYNGGDPPKEMIDRKLRELEME